MKAGVNVADLVHLRDLIALGFLIFLEAILSIDNAVALALIARRLPAHSQKKALSYGFVGAIIFRFLTVALAFYLMSWWWVQIVGGLYLLYTGIRYFFRRGRPALAPSVHTFWKVVLAIEFTDFIFGLDSVLAAVGISKKFWVVVLAGCIGLAIMRFAAALLIRLVHQRPYIEILAHGFILLVGLKMISSHFLD